MKISLVIPAYNEEKYIKTTLDSVFSHKHPDLLEIIVVDNKSTDDTFSLASTYKEVRVVQEPIKGVAFARQKGFLESKGDIVAFLDADAILPPSWFDQILDEFNNNSDLVCLSGPWFCFDVNLLYGAMTYLYWSMIAMPAYFVVGFMAAAGNMAIKRKALEDVGGFDKTIAFYGDDTDIARRLSKIGKVKFKFGFNVSTSGRRFNSQGIIRTGYLYVINYISEVFLHRPASKAYKDIR